MATADVDDAGLFDPGTSTLQTPICDRIANPTQSNSNQNKISNCKHGKDRVGQLTKTPCWITEPSTGRSVVIQTDARLTKTVGRWRTLEPVWSKATWQSKWEM